MEGEGFMLMGKPLTKVVGMANWYPVGAIEKAFQPMTQLHDKAMQGDILPCLHNSLLNVGKSSVSGYFTVFFSWGKGVEIYDAKNSKIEITGKAVIIRWQEKSGLFVIPLLNGGENDQGESVNFVTINGEAINQASNNILELPTINLCIAYLYATLSFPTKCTWLAAICHGNFVRWSIITIKNINKYYPETKEMLKGHLNQQ